MANETREQKDEALRTLPGASVDRADDDEVTKKEVAEETRQLNNNPRNNDVRMP